MDKNQNLTVLINDWLGGKDEAKDKLFPIIYDDLYNLAKSQRHKFFSNNTIDTVALVNELYIKFEQNTSLEAKDRKHFFLLSARAMRNIFLDYAKSRKRKKRGGEHQHKTLEDFEIRDTRLDMQVEEILALNESLEKMAKLYPRWAEIVDLHFFLGLSHAEIAKSLSVSTKTVSRDWKVAKKWLQDNLSS